jgi:cytochrome bd-type quinol oxidase subunit 1
MSEFTSLSEIHFPLLGNSLAIGLFSLLHIAFAGLAVGLMVLAPLMEALSRSNPVYLETAHTLTRFTLVTYTTSTVLAVIMVELFIGLFPRTNAWLFNQFRTPILVAIAAFLLQLLLLYPYYHYWDPIRAKSPRGHVTMGAFAAVLMLVWVAVLDGIGSYMLTPVTKPDTWSRLFNPTWAPLVLHRFGGDFVFAGYTIAGYGAWRIGTRPDEADKAYDRTVLKMGLLIGLGALLLQPLTGLLYALSIERSAPSAYEQLIKGPYRTLVYTQFSLIGLLFVGTHAVLRSARSTQGTSAWAEAALVVSAILMVASAAYPDIRRLFTFLLMALSGYFMYRWRDLLFGNVPHRWERPLVRGVSMALAVTALLTYWTMGTIRETARRPDTVRGILSLKDVPETWGAYREGRP